MALIGSTLVSIVLLSLLQADLGEGGRTREKVKDLEKRFIKKTDLMMEMVDQNSNDIEKATDGYRADIESLKKEHKKEISNLAKEVENLKKAATDKSNQKADSKMIAFSVTNNQRINAPAESILVLPDVLMKTGTGYDEKTGIFTAPVHGYYNFNACVMAKDNCEFNLKLIVNDKNIMGRTYGYDDHHWAQASISSFVELKAKDKVYLKVGYRSCMLYDERFTIYTGYLFQRL